MKGDKTIRIVGFLVIALFALSLLSTSAHAYTFSRSNNVAMVPSGYCNNGGSLYTGSSWPDGGSFTFTNVAVADIANGAIADPIAAGGYDTVMLMTANFNFATYWADADFSSRILSFVNGGGKLIIYDSEELNNYAGFVYPFAVNSPGATGSSGGTLVNVADDTLSSSNVADASYINLALLTSQTDAVGDCNVMTSLDSHWYIDMTAINVNNVGGPVHTYAFYGAGLIIYNGLDIDSANQAPSNANGGAAINMVWWRELCAQTLGAGQSVSGLTLSPATATNVVNTQHTVTALVKDSINNPVANVVVTFTILSGPNTGVTGQATTGANGEATFSWSSSVVGTDTVQASIPNAAGAPITTTATKTWSPLIVAPTATCGSIITYLGSTPTSQFDLGDVVTIKLVTVSPAGAESTVVVKDPLNAVVATFNNVLEGDSNSYTPLMNGVYTVNANGVVTPFAVATFFVVPESILGTLMATVAGFAAFATIGIVKRKHAKSK